MKLRTQTLKNLHNALKKAGHWYIVRVENWEHVLNEVPNCVAILFDGSIQTKFELLNNGRLKVAEIRSNLYLNLEKAHIKIGDILTVKALRRKILRYPFLR